MDNDIWTELITDLEERLCYLDGAIANVEPVLKRSFDVPVLRDDLYLVMARLRGSAEFIRMKIEEMKHFQGLTDTEG